MKHKEWLAIALCWGLMAATATPGGAAIKQETKAAPEGCTVIQKATEGRGIDLVILGDGFTAKDIADGKWKSA